MALLGGYWPEVIDGLADYVDHATERAVADRDRNRPAQVNGLHAAHHAFGGFHGNAAHAAFAEVLLHFQDHVDRHRDSVAVADHTNGLIDGRHGRLGELHVH